MKFHFIFLFFFLSFTLHSQTGEVSLIKPIKESNSMNRVQAYDFVQKNQFRNWGIYAVELEEIKNNWTGKGIKVGIVDTGVPDHPDLIDRIFGAANFSDDNSLNDGNGHSTHVAGIVNEIAPDASLYFAKVLNNQGSGSNAAVKNGIVWCQETGVDIIVLSLGSAGESLIVTKSIIDATDAGILVFAAVGNDGQHPTDNRIGWPARQAEAIGIGSINQSGNVSSFSSSGDNGGDFVTPGEDVLSTYLGGQYISFSGTSMSTPFAGGMAALFLEMGMKASDVRKRFNDTAKDLMIEGFDRYSFHGVATKQFFSKDTIITEPPIIVPPTSENWFEKNWFLIIIPLVIIIILFAFNISKKQS